MLGAENSPPPTWSWQALQKLSNWVAPATGLPAAEPDDELEELDDELDVLPVEDEEELELDEELEVFPEELEDELLELEGVGSTTPPPQAKSKALVASTPVSLIARLACDSDLILSIVLTLLVLVLTLYLGRGLMKMRCAIFVMFRAQVTLGECKFL